MSTKSIPADPFLPTTAEDALKQWDDPVGFPIRTVSLGGIGPSYEQCIHVCVFELIRDNPGGARDYYEGRPWGVATLERIGGALGLSGAQWGQARSFAARVLSSGFGPTVSEFLADNPGRMIMVSRQFPQLPEVRS